VLLAIGDVTVDLYLALPRLPKPGEDLHAARMILRAGGSAANTAAVAAQLGLPARLIGAIGQDPLGEWVAEELRASGVGTDLLQRCPEAPTSTVIVLVTPEGERTMLSHRGASRLARLPELSLPAAGFVHLSGYALLEESPLRGAALTLLQQAAAAGLRCALDPGLPACRMAPQAVREALREVEILLLNEAEADLLFGPDPRSGLQEAPRLRWIVLKQGERGCRLLGRAGEEQTVPAFRVPVRDTTGAGDAFNAGFLFGLARGASPVTAALLGNAAGALACTAWGVIGSFPGRAAVERMLREASADPTWASWREPLREAQACLAEARIAGGG
jgi:ribokinase